MDIRNEVLARRLHTELQGLVSRSVPTVERLLSETESQVLALSDDNKTEEEIFNDAMQCSKIWIAELIAEDTFNAIAGEILNSEPLKELVRGLVKKEMKGRI